MRTTGSDETLLWFQFFLIWSEKQIGQQQRRDFEHLMTGHSSLRQGHHEHGSGEKIHRARAHTPKANPVKEKSRWDDVKITKSEESVDRKEKEKRLRGISRMKRPLKRKKSKHIQKESKPSGFFLAFFLALASTSSGKLSSALFSRV